MGIGGRIKRTLTNKYFYLSIGLVAVIAITCVSIYLSNSDGGKNIGYVGGDITTRKVSDYSKSRLWMYDNGTFVVNVVYKEKVEFSGIGTWVKNGKEYEFTYVDMFRLMYSDEGEVERDLDNIGKTFEVRVEKGRLVIGGAYTEQKLYHFAK